MLVELCVSNFHTDLLHLFLELKMLYYLKRRGKSYKCKSMMCVLSLLLFYRRILPVSAVHLDRQSECSLRLAVLCSPGEFRISFTRDYQSDADTSVVSQIRAAPPAVCCGISSALHNCPHLLKMYLYKTHADFMAPVKMYHSVI